MKADGYKKYKKNITGYLTEYGETARGASWKYYDEFVSSNGDSNYFHLIPKDVATFGIWSINE